MDFVPLSYLLEGNLFIRGGLPGKLDLQVRTDRCRTRGVFRQASADCYDREFAAAGHLKRMEIPVAVAGIERFYRHCDKEIALTRVADAFPLRRMAHALHLMKRM